MSNCWNEQTRELVHQGHTATGTTYTNDEGNSVVTYRVHRCQCGGHTLDVFESAAEKAAR